MTIWCLVSSTAISDIAKWRIESSKIFPAGSSWNASTNNMQTMAINKQSRLIIKIIKCEWRRVCVW